MRNAIANLIGAQWRRVCARAWARAPALTRTHNSPVCVYNTEHHTKKILFAYVRFAFCSRARTWHWHWQLRSTRLFAHYIIYMQSFVDLSLSRFLSRNRNLGGFVLYTPHSRAPIQSHTPSVHCRRFSFRFAVLYTLNTFLAQENCLIYTNTLYSVSLCSDLMKSFVARSFSFYFIIFFFFADYINTTFFLLLAKQITSWRVSITVKMLNSSDPMTELEMILVIDACKMQSISKCQWIFSPG